jgi:adenylate cyclase
MANMLTKTRARPALPVSARVRALWSATAARLLVVVLASLGALSLWLLDPPPLKSLRLAQFDQFQRWHPRPVDAQASSVTVVDIDEASLKAFGQWPWPRTRLAELVQRLHEAGAAAIAFDVLLAEPDRTSPGAMAPLWNNPAASALLQGLPDHDAVLAGTLPSRGVVLGSSLSRSGAVVAPASIPGAPAPPYRVIQLGAPDPQRWLHGFDTLLAPMAMLQARAAGMGAMNFAPDGDGVVRRVPLFLRVGDQAVPTLSAEALRVAQGATNHVLRSTPAGVQDVRIGAVTVPTNAQAEIWLHYPAESATRTVSAAQALGGSWGAGRLEGQIVLVGSSAAGLMDLRFSPMGQLVPGVQLHAMALDQMLSSQHVQRPAWAAGAEGMVLVLGVLVVGLVSLGASIWWSALLSAGVLLALFGGAWYAFVMQQLLFDAVNPAGAIGLAFVLASGVHHLVSERERAWVRQAFSRYVSPNRVAHLMAHPEQLRLSGQRQNCSFVFTDLAGFTSLLEASDPAEIVTRLNDYLEGMLQIVFKHDGTLERIMGDAVAVLFSAPVVQTDYRQRALDCALEMDAFAHAFAQGLQARGLSWGHTRIGVHCGEVIVGNFGGKTLFDYRALGDPINTAARLEGVNKYLGTRVCVSQAILDGCTGVAVRAVGRVLLKGKSQPLQAFEPLAATDSAACADPAEYAAAMHLMQPGDAHQPWLARDAFEQLAARHPHDPLVALHLERLREGATDDLIVLADK